MHEFRCSGTQDGCSASPANDDMLVWNATIMGPPDTAWEGGIFSLRLTFSDASLLTPPYKHLKFSDLPLPVNAPIHTCSRSGVLTRSESLFLNSCPRLWRSLPDCPTLAWVCTP